MEKLWNSNVQRFADEGAAAPTGEAAAAAESADSAEPADAGRGMTETTTTAAAAPGSSFDDYIKEHKTEAEQWFQQRFNARHKDYKTMQERASALAPALELLGKGYGWDGKDYSALAKAIIDDDQMYQARALANGRTASEQKEWERIERENSQLRSQMQAADDERREREEAARIMEGFNGLRKAFPEVNIGELARDPQFVQMTQNGVDFVTAYRAMHMEELMRKAQNDGEAAGAQRVAASVRSNLARPAENGNGGAPVNGHIDVASLTDAQLDEYAERARRGEKITFR